MESKSEKENQEEEIDLTPHEHERPFKGAFKSFVILMHLKQNAQDTEGNAGDKGRPVIPVNPKPQEKDAFEKEEMNKSKPVVKKTS